MAYFLCFCQHKSLTFLFTSTEIQTALYELCWQVVQGNLKSNLVTDVLRDMMVNMFFITFIVCVLDFTMKLIHSNKYFLQTHFSFLFQEFRDDMPSILADVFSILGTFCFEDWVMTWGRISVLDIFTIMLCFFFISCFHRLGDWCTGRKKQTRPLHKLSWSVFGKNYYNL